MCAIERLCLVSARTHSIIEYAFHHQTHTPSSNMHPSSDMRSIIKHTFHHQTHTPSSTMHLSPGSGLCMTLNPVYQTLNPSALAVSVFACCRYTQECRSGETSCLGFHFIFLFCLLSPWFIFLCTLIQVRSIAILVGCMPHVHDQFAMQKQHA